MTVAGPWLLLSGAVVGVLSGAFGVGGSSLATPLLGLLGVPGVQAVASPLPATIPVAIAGGVAYIRSGEVRWRIAVLSLVGAVPFAVLGALLARVLGGYALLVASGFFVVILGARVVLPISEDTRAAGIQRREGWARLVGSTAVVGLLTGLLANGGGFLLVPLYLLVFGLRMRAAAGTSLAVIAGLSVPTVVVHWAVGNIDWRVALLFAAGALPGSVLGSYAVHHTVQRSTRTAFGWSLVLFGLYFTWRQLFG